MFNLYRFSALYDLRNKLSQKSEMDLSLSILNSVKNVEQLKRPRFIKTHLPFNMLPKQITANEKRPKIIYVMRNAKDTCVSYYHHCKLLEGYRGNFDQFCKLFLAGKRNYFLIYLYHILNYK